LEFGRALGETLAVTMLIGNANIIPTGLFSTGNTMASVIANQFGEASGLQLSALIEIGLLLFVITTIINAVGKFIIKRFA
jgi:phosphate transport system permease protein